MTIDIDELKKKIIYRSNYRGTKEMDKLLGSFTKKNINNLNHKDLIDLEKLIPRPFTSKRRRPRSSKKYLKCGDLWGGVAHRPSHKGSSV